MEAEAEVRSLKRELQWREPARNRALKIAERVQRSMLPEPVHHHDIDIDVRYVPLEAVGGDYCQVLFPVDTCCYVTICDVAGHGIGPALNEPDNGRQYSMRYNGALVADFHRCLLDRGCGTGGRRGVRRSDRRSRSLFSHSVRRQHAARTLSVTGLAKVSRADRLVVSRILLGR